MILLGVDIAILAIVASAMVAVSFVLSYTLNMTETQGNICVATACVCSFGMLVAYAIMAKVLDMVVGMVW